MSWTRSTILLFLAVFAAAILLPAAGHAAPTGPCTAVVVSTLVPPDPSGTHAPASSGNSGVGLIPTFPLDGEPLLNQEGLTERPADLLVYDNGSAAGATTACFIVGRQIIITYNASLTTPNPVVANSSDLDVMDSAGTSGLVVSVATSIGLSTFDTPQTVITITVLQAGTFSSGANLLTGYVGAAIRLKNLRFDVTSLAGTGTPLQATVSTNPATNVDPSASGSSLLDVGFPAPTISPESEGVEIEGFGFQSTPPDLCINQGELGFAEGFPHSFRTAITSPPVFGDINTGDTSLIFNVTGIPSGVTVTFPSSLANSMTFGTPALVWTARSATLSATGGNLSVIYDTTTSGPGPGGFELSTNGTASTVTSTTVDTTVLEDIDPSDGDTPFVTPYVGVAVGASTGFGEADIQVIFGPTPTAQPGGMDDVQPAAIPRYIPNTGGGAPTRLVTSGAFFDILPIETVLLYPYVTDTFGYATGLEVANTGNTTAMSPTTKSVFSAGSCEAAGQSGSLTFYFFPNAGTPFFWTPTNNSVITRGLDANGNLDPGHIAAVPIDALLTAAGQGALVGNFDGYVIVVAEFNFAHGYSVIFNNSGNGVGSSNALVLGPFDGERQGVAGGLPEALKQVPNRQRKH